MQPIANPLNPNPADAIYEEGDEDEDALDALLQQGRPKSPKEVEAEALAAPGDFHTTLHGVPVRRLTLSDALILLRHNNIFMTSAKGDVTAELGLRSTIEVIYLASRETARHATAESKRADYNERLDEFAGQLPLLGVGDLMSEVQAFVNANTDTRVEVTSPESRNPTKPGND